MAKGKSWGPTQEAYVNSELNRERIRCAELTGVLHRAAGLLGCVASVDALSEWCAKQEEKRRADRQTALAVELSEQDKDLTEDVA